MVYVDASFISKQIDRFGETVTVKVYGPNKVYSDYGDLVTTSTTSYIGVKSIFNTYGQTQTYVSEGAFAQTKFSFFFKPDQSGLDIDNVIIRSNGESWKINRPLKHSLSGKTVVIEAAVQNG